MAAPNDNVGSAGTLETLKRLQRMLAHRYGRQVYKALLQATSPTRAMAVFGGWAVDGDGAQTNGGGLVGAEPLLTTQTATFAKVEDDTVFQDLATSGAAAAYTANFQLYPDTPVALEDHAYFGAAVPFAEVAFDAATPAVYDSTDVTVPTYWDGSAWVALTLVLDNTEATAQDGSEILERDGAMLFLPPTDWVAVAVDGQVAYWIRFGIAAAKAANMTTVPILADEHKIVTADDAWTYPADSQIVGIRASSGAGTLGSANDTLFIVMNTTKGTRTAELTWTQTTRSAVFSDLNLLGDAGDAIAVYVTQEDGSDEHDTVLFELELANPQQP